MSARAIRNPPTSPDCRPIPDPADGLLQAGTRKDDARMGPIAKIMSDEDVRQAAEYFARVEAESVGESDRDRHTARTFIATSGRHRVLHPMEAPRRSGAVFLKSPRIRTARKSRPAFRVHRLRAAGQHRQGEALVKRRRVREDGAVCDLSRRRAEGHGRSPRLAGMQPLYLAGSFSICSMAQSAGKAAELKKPVVANLSEDDIIAISSYLAHCLRSKDHRRDRNQPVTVILRCPRIKR